MRERMKLGYLEEGTYTQGMPRRATIDYGQVSTLGYCALASRILTKRVRSTCIGCACGKQERKTATSNVRIQ